MIPVSPRTLPLSLATLDQHMIHVEGGEFTMGDTRYKDATPHRVRLDDFEACRYPVTQRLWQEVMGELPKELAFRGPDRPVECISRHDCQDFLIALNAQTDGGYGLPSEAQWEYAARGGRYAQPHAYAGSEDRDEVAWYDQNSYDETHPTGLKPPNALGLHDMSGNVFEWCDDWYDEGYYQACADQGTVSSPAGPESGPESGTARVVRGGAWVDYVVDLRVAFRLFTHPVNRDHFIGFRLFRYPAR